MIYNDEKVDITKVDAIFEDNNVSIEITADDKNMFLCFNDKSFDPMTLNINEKISIVDKIYWDVELVTKDTYYLFDISKDVVDLTRIDDNLFKVDVSITNPDIIFCPLDNDNCFKKLIISVNFSFYYRR